MKIPVESFVISALLTLAVSLSMPAFAQNPKASSVISVSGTTWVGTGFDGDSYEYSSQADGAFHYKSPSGLHTNGAWKQDGNSIYMETNNKYSEYRGLISGTHIEGKTWNIKGHIWTWVADRKSQTLATPTP